MHVAGVKADARTFEHTDPALVGNSRDVLISELSGKGSVVSRAEGAGIDLDADAAKRAVERLKEREHLGYQYEAADASFELLLRRETGSYEPLFRLEGFRVITEKRADGKVETEATIKIWVDGRRYVRTAEGNGPVNALDRALREAITELHPHLAEIELVNYKVRILDAHHGTGAVTRVLLDSSDGQDSWGSIGVSENIIEASWEALVDSLEYAFQPRRPPVATRALAAGRGPVEPASGPRERSQPEPIPLASAPTSGRARRSWCWRCSARGGCRWARCWSASSATSPPGWGSRTRSPSPPAPPPSISASARSAGAPGDEVITSPFSFVASANCLLYEGATPVFCDVDPVTLNLDPAAAARGGGRAHRRAPARGHPRLPGGDAGARAARGGVRPGHARRRLRGPRSRRLRGRPGRRARQPGHLRLLCQQAARPRAREA